MLLNDVDAVVFDKDGTLVDVQLTWGPAMTRTLTDLFADVELRERVAGAIGLNLADSTLTDDSPVIAETTGEIGARVASVTGEPVQDVTEALDRLITHHTQDTVVPLEGVDAVLSALRDTGVWVGLATNDGEQSASDQLAALGLVGRFDSIIGYDSGFGGKPGPGMLDASAQRADCTIDRLVMVGDTPTDVRAANAAGCRVVVVGDAEMPTDLDITAVVGSVSDVPALFGI